jgi:hypothetical protein
MSVAKSFKSGLLLELLTLDGMLGIISVAI